MENNAQEQSKSDMLDAAYSDMQEILEEMASMFQSLKKAKFDYLKMTCELYTKVDLPSIMMDNCDRDIKELLPAPDKLRNMRQF